MIQCCHRVGPGGPHGDQRDPRHCGGEKALCGDHGHGVGRRLDRHGAGPGLVGERDDLDAVGVARQVGEDVTPRASGGAPRAEGRKARVAADKCAEDRGRQVVRTRKRRAAAASERVEGVPHRRGDGGELAEDLVGRLVSDCGGERQRVGEARFGDGGCRLLDADQVEMVGSREGVKE